MADVLTGGDLHALTVLVALLAAWHDIGKASPCFQSKDSVAFARTGARPYLGDNLPHARAGYLHVVSWLERFEYDSASTRLVAQAIAGHHGIFGRPSRAGVTEPDYIHRGLHDGYPADDGPWAKLRDEVMRTVAEALVPDGSWRLALKKVQECGDTEHASMYVPALTACVISADWVVSAVEHLRPESAPRHRSELSAWIDERRTTISDLIKGLGIDGPALVAKESMADHFPFVEGFAPRGVQVTVQEELLTLGPGLFILMGPTGSGKSYAGDYAAALMADGEQGIAFALPTRATADAQFEDMVEFAKATFDQPTRLTLMHSSSYNVEEYRGTRTRTATLPGADAERTCGLVEATDWLMGYKRGLLAPNTLCTIDQLLTSVIADKWSPMPMLGVLSKVPIIDEVHAFDPHMNLLYERLLGWMASLGKPVVAMSATLSHGTATRMANAYRKGLGYPSETLDKVHYPGWIHVSAETGKITGGTSPSLGERVTKVVCKGYPVEDRGSHRNLAHAVVESLAPVLSTGSGNALVVTNTVNACIETKRAVVQAARDSGFDIEVKIVHSRFPMQQKRGHMTWLMQRYGKKARTSRPRASVVIATQIVEQSLDVDFDLLITQVAPVALLIQRDGREHRHEATTHPPHLLSPTMVVLAEQHPDGRLVEKDRRPYDHIFTQLTWNELLKLPCCDGGERLLNVPGDVQPLMNAVYDNEFWLLSEDLQLRHASTTTASQRAETVARIKAIPLPSQLGDDLRKVTDSDAKERSARYDMDAVDIVPVVRRKDGSLRIGTAGGPAAQEQMTKRGIKALADWAVSVSPRGWKDELVAHSDALVPKAWHRDSRTRHVLLILQQGSALGVQDHGVPAITTVDLVLHPEDGLQITYQERQRS